MGRSSSSTEQAGLLLKSGQKDQMLPGRVVKEDGYDQYRGWEIPAKLIQQDSCYNWALEDKAHRESLVQKRAQRRLSRGWSRKSLCHNILMTLMLC